jgi:hypothetical protein
MAPLLDSAARQAQEMGLIKAIAASVIVVAVVVGLAIAFGWTLPVAPSFEVLPDPAGDLAF